MLLRIMENKQTLESFTSQTLLTPLTDDELLGRLSALLQKSRCVESELVAHIGEVDRRKLYLKKASSSMFTYCTEVLNLSESEAYHRIAVARASRKHPILLEMLGDGRLHLSGIAKLVPYLTEANCETLLDRAAKKSKREIIKLVAEIAPKPDVVETIRKLPERQEKTQPTLAPPGELRPVAVQPPPAPAPVEPLVLEPLSPSRFKVQFTASAEFPLIQEKLERLLALMRSSVPSGELAAILEQAVTEKIEQLESRRYGKTKTPRKSLEETDTAPSSRPVPAAVKRAVCERDGDQCTFLDNDGRRCTERDNLEFHHDHPYGRGGNHSLENIHLMCHPHNDYLAELDYGKEKMEQHRHSTSRVSEPLAAYTIGNRTPRAQGEERALSGGGGHIRTLIDPLPPEQVASSFRADP